jgi:hypothetical protein
MMWGVGASIAIVVVAAGCTAQPAPLTCTKDSQCHNGERCDTSGECVANTPAGDAGAADSGKKGGATCSATGWSFTLSTCSSCATSSCCTELAACNNDQSCLDFAKCIEACTTSACMNQCKSTYAEGASTFATLDNCLGTTCKSSCTPKKGIGDGCMADVDCVSGTTCTEHNSGTTGWCTKPCSGNSQTSCPGLHNGKNENGEYNWCVNTSQGYECFPGCDLTSASCGELGSSTCQNASTYNNTSVKVCSY